MHPLTFPYAMLVGRAYAEPGVWQQHTLASGHVLAVRVPLVPARLDRRTHEVAVLAAVAPVGEARAAFDHDVETIMRYLDTDARYRWLLARQGPTKSGGLTARFACERKPRDVPATTYALPMPAEQEQEQEAARAP